MTDLQVTHRRDGDVGILDVNGEVRLEIGSKVQSTGRTLLDEGVRHLVVDLGGVTFMDSASLGVLIELNELTSQQNGKLVLCDVSEAVQRVLLHAGLEGRFAVADSAEDARNSLAD